MTDAQTRLACLNLTGGDIEKARKLIDFVCPTADGAKCQDAATAYGVIAEKYRGATIPVNSPGGSPLVDRYQLHQGMNNAELAAVLGAEADDRGLADRVRGGGLWFWDGKSFKRV